MKTAAKNQKHTSQMKTTTKHISQYTAATYKAFRTDLLSKGFKERHHSERGQRWTTFDQGSIRYIINRS